jgi:hypothetical protein
MSSSYEGLHMPQPVKLSDELIETARATADDARRSLAGQIEHWASIGRAVEGMLTANDVHALKRFSAAANPGGASNQREAIVNALVAALRPEIPSLIPSRIATVNPVRYGTDPVFPGLTIRVDADGAKTPGRFIGRSFVPLAELQSARPELSDA